MNKVISTLLSVILLVGGPLWLMYLFVSSVFDKCGLEGIIEWGFALYFTLRFISPTLVTFVAKVIAKGEGNE